MIMEDVKLLSFCLSDYILPVLNLPVNSPSVHLLAIQHTFTQTAVISSLFTCNFGDTLWRNVGILPILIFQTVRAKS